MSSCSESSTALKHTKSKKAPNVGTFASVSGHVDSHIDGVESHVGDEYEVFHHDEDFFILTGKQRIELIPKNSFTQKDFLSFFCMLHLLLQQT